MPSNIQSFNQHENREEKVSRLKPKIPHPLEPVSRYPLYIYIYIYIPSHNYLAIKKNVRSFSNGEKEDRATSRSKEMEEDQANSEIRYFSVPSRKGGARATGRAAASLRVDWKGKRVRGGENEEGPDASMKSHVPSRVHRNVGRLATVSGYARACWWSPGFSSAQVDATRAPHARRARGTAEGSGGHRVSVVEQQRWRLARGRGEAGTEYGRGH